MVDLDSFSNDLVYLDFDELIEFQEVLKEELSKRVYEGNYEEEN